MSGNDFRDWQRHMANSAIARAPKLDGRGTVRPGNPVSRYLLVLLDKLGLEGKRRRDAKPIIAARMYALVAGDVQLPAQQRFAEDVLAEAGLPQSPTAVREIVLGFQECVRLMELEKPEKPAATKLTIQNERIVIP